MTSHKQRPKALYYAIALFNRGFTPIPLVPGTKRPALRWDPWLEALSVESLREHYDKHPDHELAVIPGDGLIVFDADTPESVNSLYMLEEQFDLVPDIIVETAKGEHHVFAREAGVHAKASSHSSDKHPARIDLKTDRGLVAVAPSTGKRLQKLERSYADKLTPAPQAFIDAIARHNGQAPPSEVAERLASPPPANEPVALEPVADSPELEQLRVLLEHIDPDIGYDDWLKCGMALHHACGGHAEGLRLFDDWSSAGKKYTGHRDISTKYASFARNVGDRVTVGTVLHLARQLGVDEEAIKRSERKAIFTGTMPGVTEGLDLLLGTAQATPAANEARPGAELLRYSLMGKSALFEEGLFEDISVLDGIAMMAQWTMMFAPPNIGKTLLTIRLLLDAIEAGTIDPEHVFYVNADDNHAGLRSKLHIAEAAGFHMLAPGWEDFTIDSIVDLMQQMVRSGSAEGAVLIIDTAKKFVDPMDKTACRRFGNAARPFTTRGGTVICLAHVNKNRSKDGSVVYGGTSDLRDDADCAFTIDQIDEGNDTRTVEFRNIKFRGGVSKQRVFRYSTADGQSYQALLDSVEAVEADAAKPSAEEEHHTALLDAITAAIQAGNSVKGHIIQHVRDATEFTRGEVTRALEAGSGDDPDKHRWQQTRGKHNAWVYTLLSTAEQ